MIFLVSVITYREIISTEMFHMGNAVLMAQVSASWSIGVWATVPDSRHKVDIFRFFLPLHMAWLRVMAITLPGLAALPTSATELSLVLLLLLGQVYLAG